MQMRRITQAGIHRWLTSDRDAQYNSPEMEKKKEQNELDERIALDTDVPVAMTTNVL